MTTFWKETPTALEKTIECPDFMSALAFVNKVGEAAEALHHHPDLCIRDYRNVFISITTHDRANTVTEKDRELARIIDTLI